MTPTHIVNAEYNRKAVREALEAAAPDAEVWRGEAGDLAIGFMPEDEDGEYVLVGTASEYLVDMTDEA